MKISLGELVPALEGWFVCEMSSCSGDCVVCIELPSWCRSLGEKARVYVLLYVAARSCMDYRLVAALYLYSVGNRVFVDPGLLSRVWREARVVSRLPRRIEDDSVYAWRAVFYRGILYAQAILDLEKPVLVKIIPPRDRRGREKLRVFLEGKRTSRKKIRSVRGFIGEIGGEKIAPWIYIVPKKNLPKLLSKSMEYGFRVDILLK